MSKGADGKTQAAVPATVPATVPRAAKGAPSSGLRRQRDLAKKGMLVSLGAVTVTGVMLMYQTHRRGRTSGAAIAHVAAGLAMVGTSWWHHVLYPPAKK